jgi:tRNA(Ile)-lysidine synthase
MGSSELQNHSKAREEQIPGLVAQALSIRCGVSTGESLVVAVSGGSDSMGMLHAMIRMEGMDPSRLVVAHVNHGLRGDESELDQDLVRHTSSVLGIRFASQSVNVPKKEDSGGESLEMVCRKLRHAALAQICRDCGVHRICLAHTADDQVEHFLLRLLRGAGSAGLRGMGWVNPSPMDPSIRLMRPVLGATRGELRAFLSRIGGNFREDSSNNDPSIPRNRIRHEVLPMLRQVAGPSLDHLIRRSMEIVGAEGTLAESMAALWGINPSHSPFDSEHVAVQRIVIRNQLINIGVKPEFRIIEALRCPGRNSVVVAGGLRVTKNASGSLSLSHEAIPSVQHRSATASQTARLMPTGPNGFINLPGPARIEWRRMDRVPAEMPHPQAEALFDAATLEGGFRFRHWRPGDRFRALGMAGRTKLQDLFVNRKIPKSRRHELWIGEDSMGEVFWIEGFPPSEDHKIRSDSQAVLGMRCLRNLGFCESVPER